MKIKLSEITPVIGLLLTLFVSMNGWIAANITRQSYLRGPIPEKRLSVQDLISTDVLEAIHEAKEVASVSVAANGTQLKNLFASTEVIENDGLSPILPGDIFERISVSTDPPWKIIAITSSEIAPNHISFKWRKDNDTQFSADAALINPGDQIWMTIYTTHLSDVVKANETITPPLNWNTRIANLHGIIKKYQISPLDILKSQFIPIIIYGITGDQIIIILIMFSLYLIIYTYLFNRLGIFRYAPYQIAAWMVTVGILSISAAESGSDYLVQPLYPTNITLMPNALIILSNFVLTTILFFKSIYGEDGRTSEGNNT